jgi:uncharacterized protein (TIGR03435 family)
MLAAGEFPMIPRLLLALSVVAAPCAWGQGVYGPVTAHVKAGDRAPDLVFTNTLSSPVPGSWSPQNLTGPVTVLGFFPDTTDNPQLVTLWNAAVEKFAGKPVQFVWITGQDESRLLPWLAQHPIKGWVFEDAKGRTGNAYGMEMPVGVIVGADGRLVGFSQGLIGEIEQLVTATEEGRITTTPQTQASLPAFMAAHKVLMDAEPFRFPRADEYKPAFAPSTTLHVSPAQKDDNGNYGGDDFRSLKGYTVRAAIEDFYDMPASRLVLPAALDDGKRYNFAIVLPEGEGRDKVKPLGQAGLEDYYHLTARHEERIMDVYVMSAMPGRKLPVSQLAERGMHGSGGSIDGGGEFDPATNEFKPGPLSTVRGISVDGTVAELCDELQHVLDRPLVNETRLEGEFDFSAQAAKGAPNNFAEVLRDRLGLVITPERRSVDMLVFSPR